MQERYIATADLGSSKIALCVARVMGTDTHIIYYRESASDGIRASCVFNPTKAAKALQNAVSLAEEELGIKIHQVVVGLPRYSVRQEIASATMKRTNPDECITDEEIDILKSIALESYPLNDPENEEIYGAVAQSFSADDMMGPEDDIVGTTAAELTGNFKIFIGAKKALTNIDTMMSKLGIAAAPKYFLPSLVADSVLTPDEKDNGVALIEIGAGVSSVTIYEGDVLRHYSSIPFGGRSITTDIKYECAFNEALAENIKLAFGACMPEKLQSLSEKILQINDEETGSYEHLPVKYLSEIITARCREIVDALLYNVQESRYADRLRSGIVITGGGANIANLSGLIKEMSGYNVRIGFPRTRSISVEGCNGTGETGAVASIGMMLEAVKLWQLNCIEELPDKSGKDEGPEIAEEQGGQEEVKERESYEGSILDPKANMEKPQKPKETKKDKSDKKRGLKLEITWIKDKAKNVMGVMDDIFNSTVGGFYDDMGKESEK